MFRRKSRAQSDPGISFSAASGKIQRRRCSLPDKGVLKYLSADESLSTVYGSERSFDDGNDKHSPTERRMMPNRRSHCVIFTDIEIREYARTVGDNPSCSSGPPMSYVLVVCFCLVCVSC